MRETGRISAWRVLAAAVCICAVCGCYTNRVNGVLPRNGELFKSTRTPLGENNGGPIIYVGYMLTPTVVGPVVLVPTGLAVGVLDQFVFSPFWDVLCIPRDCYLASQGCGGVVVDYEGNPIRGAVVKPAFGRPRETDASGRFFLPVSTEACRNYGITVSKEGYYPCGTNAAQNLRLEMRKIGRKVRMKHMALRMNEGVPVNEPMGYDCLLNDWLPPYGKGKSSDLQVVWREGPAVNGVTPVQVVLSVNGRHGGFVQIGGTDPRYRDLRDWKSVQDARPTLVIGGERRHDGTLHIVHFSETNGTGAWAFRTGLPGNASDREADCLCGLISFTSMSTDGENYRTYAEHRKVGRGFDFTGHVNPVRGNTCLEKSSWDL